MRRLLSALGLVGLILAGLVVVPVPAQAHGALISARPAPGDHVLPGVRALSLLFPTLREDGPHQVLVTDEAGTPIAAGRPVPVPDGTDQTTLCLSVASLDRPGVYAITYQAASPDGDWVGPGRFYFEVSASGRKLAPSPECQGLSLPTPTTPEPVDLQAPPRAASTVDPPARSSFPGWGLLGAGGVVALVLTAVVGLRRSDRRSTDKHRADEPATAEQE